MIIECVHEWIAIIVSYMVIVKDYSGILIKLKRKLILDNNYIFLFMIFLIAYSPTEHMKMEDLFS